MRLSPLRKGGLLLHDAGDGERLRNARFSLFGSSFMLVSYATALKNWHYSVLLGTGG